MTRTALRRLGAVLAGAALALSVAGPADAAAQGQIENVKAIGETLTALFSVTGLTAGSTIDPRSIQASLEGQRLAVKADRLAASGRVVRRSVILLIDTSQSMAGPRIQAARQAAGAFLADVPPDVEVGLTTFSDRPKQLVAPTLQRSAIAQQVAGLQITPNGGTALFRAVAAASASMGGADLRSIVLLSDGADDRQSGTTLVEAIRAADRAQVRINAVALASTADQLAQLSLLTARTNGLLTKARVGNLSKIFASTAQTLTSQLSLTITVPRDLAGVAGNLTISGKVGKATISQSAFVTLPRSSPPTVAPRTGPVAVAASGTPLVGRSALPYGLLALLLGLAVLLGLSLPALAPADTVEGRVRRRLATYSVAGRRTAALQPADHNALGAGNVARSAVGLAGRVMARRQLQEVLGARLEAAGVPLRPEEWLIIHVALPVVTGIALLLVSGGRLSAALLGAVLGLLAPWLYLALREGRRTSNFLAQLPDTLQLLAGSLSAGYSLPQAVDTVAKETQAPISTELNRAIVEARLGMQLEDALVGVATRMRSADFAWVVMAVRIQREVGGNLAEILATVAETLRERERLRRQVKALSAEGRLSAWILGALPVVFASYLVLARPAYLRPLYTDPLGYAMLLLGAGLLTIGVLWLRRVVRVEV